MKQTTIVEIIAALFILLFLYTALSKIYDYNNFRFVLAGSPMIGNISSSIAVVLPITEIIIAALLFIPKTKLFGFYGAFVLMTIFTFYIGYMIVFAPKLPCSCGGVLKLLTWKQHFIFNIFFILLALIGILIKRRTYKVNLGQKLDPYLLNEHY